MIISNNNNADTSLFQDIMQKTDSLLNHDAKIREDYYKNRNGKLLEEDVYKAIAALHRRTLSLMVL